MPQANKSEKQRASLSFYPLFQRQKKSASSFNSVDSDDTIDFELIPFPINHNSCQADFPMSSKLPRKPSRLLDVLEESINQYSNTKSMKSKKLISAGEEESDSNSDGTIIFEYDNDKKEKCNSPITENSKRIDKNFKDFTTLINPQTPGVTNTITKKQVQNFTFPLVNPKEFSTMSKTLSSQITPSRGPTIYVLSSSDSSDSDLLPPLNSLKTESTPINHNKTEVAQTKAIVTRNLQLGRKCPSCSILIKENYLKHRMSCRTIPEFTERTIQRTLDEFKPISKLQQIKEGSKVTSHSATSSFKLDSPKNGKILNNSKSDIGREEIEISELCDDENSTENSVNKNAEFSDTSELSPLEDFQQLEENNPFMLPFFDQIKPKSISSRGSRSKKLQERKIDNDNSKRVSTSKNSGRWGKRKWGYNRKRMETKSKSRGSGIAPMKRRKERVTTRETSTSNVNPPVNYYKVEPDFSVGGSRGISWELKGKTYFT